MTKQVFVFVIAFLAFQVSLSKTSNVKDLIDEAKKQLEELRSTVKESILVAHNNLDTLDYDFLANNHNIIAEAVASIQLEADTINSLIAAIQVLAHSANKDISSCVDTRQEVLNKLPEEYNNVVKQCIFGLNREEAKVVSETKFFVDNSMSTVQRLENQFEQCNNNILCILPLVNQILLYKGCLPLNIEAEVHAIKFSLHILKASANQCSESSVSGYTSDANSILQNIISCANRIIG